MVDGLAESVGSAFHHAGIGQAELVREESCFAAFGDGQVTFRLDDLLLRVTRDRGQIFLDLGSTAVPSAFFQFADVEVAMGWRAPAQVANMPAAESLEDTLRTVAGHLVELKAAFATKNQGETRALIERVALARGESILSKLRGDIVD